MRRILISIVTIAIAATAVALPLSGGGPADTDCHAEFATTRMKLNYPPLNPQSPAPRTEVRCFDGDPGCDSDGTVDGSCVFDIDVCLRNQDAELPACSPQDVVAASASESGLSGALAALLPATSTSCTEGQVVEVAVNGEAVAQTVTVEATTAGDVTDSDEVTFVCVPHGWPAHGNNFANHNSNPLESAFDLTNAGALGVKWHFDARATESAGGFHAITSTPVVGNGMVYTTSWNGKLYALDPDNGEVVWRYESNARFLGLEGSPTLTADARVVITADKTVECLDARDGSLLWSTVVSEAPESEMWGAATVANGRVFVGVASAADAPCASDGKLSALDLDSGEILWSYVTTPERVCRTDTAVECSEDADCRNGGPCVIARGAGITARPTVDPTGEYVFANTVGCFTFPSIADSDTVMSFVAATGELRWKNRVQPPEQFGFCPDDDAVECRDDSDCGAGTCRAKALFHDFGFLNGPLYIDADDSTIGRPLIVSGSKDGTLYALDPDTGERVWTNAVVPTPVSPGLASWGLFNGSIAFAEGRIFAGLHDVAPRQNPDHLQAFGIADGEAVWTNPFDLTWGDSSVASGLLFIGDCGNNTNCKSVCNNQECPTGTHYVVDASDGRILKQFSTPAPVAGTSSIVDGVVYAPYGLSGAAGGVRAYAIACPGDCNLDGRTDVSELTRGVGESLDRPDTAECGIFDRNADGKIGIDELVLAVRANLEGCATGR